MATKFRGSFPIILTPFNDNEDLDLAALEDQIDWLIDRGSPGLFLTGSWGEYGQLSDEERRQVFAVGLKRVAKRVPVFVGICGLGQTTRQSIEFGKLAEDCGADGLMVKQFFYIDQQERRGPVPEVDLRDGILDYFEDVSKAVDIPIMLYNVHGMVTATPAIQAELADLGFIQYVKECTGIVTLQQTIHLAGDKLTMFNGMEDSALPAFVLGAEGWCSGTAVVATEISVKLFDLVDAGKIAEARELWYRLMPLTIFLEAGKGIQLMKYALALLGHPCGTARRPRAAITPDEKQKMKAMLAELELI